MEDSSPIRWSEWMSGHLSMSDYKLVRIAVNFREADDEHNFSSPLITKCQHNHQTSHYRSNNHNIGVFPF